MSTIRKALRFRQLPDLVKTLQDAACRHHDLLVHPRLLRAGLLRTQVPDSEGVMFDIYDIGVENKMGVAARDAVLPLQPHVLPQLCMRTDPAHERQFVKAEYIRDLFTLANQKRDGLTAELAVENINHMLKRVPFRRHKGGADKVNFVRLLADTPVKDDGGKLLSTVAQDASFAVRAILSDSFRPLDHTALLMTVVQTITNKLRFAADAVNYAAGALAIDWGLSDVRMDICIANPTMAFDLKNPDRGVFKTDFTAMGHTAHEWLQPGRDDQDGTHLVFPAARVSNSEVGYGSLDVTAGYYERICCNRAMAGTALMRRHTGRIITSIDDGASDETRKRSDALVFSQAADAVRVVFDPEEFLAMMQKFSGLFKVKVDDVRVAVAQVCGFSGLSAEFINDILLAYQPMTPEVHTLGDVQRAVTAQVSLDKHAENAEQRMAFEDAGGAILAAGVKALSGKKPRVDAVLAGA